MSEPTSPSRSLAIVGAAAVSALVIVGLFAVGIVDHDLADVLPVIMAVAVPTITSLFTIAGVRTDLEQVRRSVNGNLDRVVAERDELSRYATDLLHELDQINRSGQPPTGRHRPANEGTPQ